MNNATAIRRLNAAKNGIRPYVDFRLGEEVADDKQISINQVYLNIKGVLGSMHKKQGVSEAFHEWYLNERKWHHSKRDNIMSLSWSINNWRMMNFTERESVDMPAYERNFMIWLTEDDYKYFNERFEQCVNAINNKSGDDENGTTYPTL